MASRKRSLPNDSDVSHLYKELDEALCPICMDHPHNAVLLICSSHDRSCRPYICDTSYRHSNCLDRFKKLKQENASETSLVPGSNQDSVLTGSLDLTVMTDHAMPQGGSVGYSTDDVNPDSGEQGGTTVGTVDIGDANLEKSEEVSKLRCPLCRGEVLGMKVVKGAREYLNLKARSCSHESCSFTGNYRELRRHARRVHPTVCPADVDLTRQRAWRHLENQREYNDIVSAIHSTMPGAIVVGDYVVDGGDRLLGHRGRSGGAGEGDRLSTFFVVQMFGSPEPGSDLRGSRSRLLPRHRRAAGALSRRRYIWGENLLGHQNLEDGEIREADLTALSDTDNGRLNTRRRQRRRLTRAEPDENQQ